MELYSVTKKNLPEVYYLSFSGEYFEVYINQKYWKYFVSFAKKTKGGATNWEANGVQVLNTFEGLICIRIPALTLDCENDTGSNPGRDCGRAFSEILHVLRIVLHSIEKQGEEVVDESPSQLFALGAWVGESSGFHTASLGLSLSPRCRQYLESFGKSEIDFELAREAMRQYHEMIAAKSESEYSYSLAEFEVGLRERGVLHLNTVGSCACLGAQPCDFGDRGCHLSSYNVDTVTQQFSLIVGISSIWQSVRNEIYFPK